MGASFSITYYQFISTVCPQMYAQIVINNPHPKEYKTQSPSENLVKKNKTSII